jgi:hypothetical protein
MHPTFTNCDMLKSKLPPYMKIEEVKLLANSEFHYKINVHLNIKAVKVQVDSNEAATAGDFIAKAFFDETFLQDISNNNPKYIFDFILAIQKQVMPHETYCAAIDSHCKLNENLISISITGVHLSKTPITVDYLGEPPTFPEMIKTIKDMNGILFFTHIKLMLSESACCLLLLTTKDKFESSERALDIIFEMMAAKGYYVP